MHKMIRENIHAAYGLHDMDVVAFEIQNNDIIMKTQSGLVRVAEPCVQVDGYVEFHNLDWDFCYVYLLNHNGNIGSFTGEKMMLADFIRQYESFVFSVVDEVYGYNQTKYWGYLTVGSSMQECIIEIYHTGDMIFVET